MSIEAMKLALETLEQIPYGNKLFDESSYEKQKDAIYSLRQAIEQAEKQEPVAWMHNFITGNVITHKPADIDRHPERWTLLYTAPPKREWVNLAKEDMPDGDNPMFDTYEFYAGMAWAQTKLKEKNDFR